ncbi:hypothetical protein [Roseovarius indicus]|uniref:hypothetical protein n=2 Tax=Roseovarius indicus TaxID=540747 RepID=UPI0007DA0E5F|nr:hypothetical protein [Roseovarius indicus]OAO06404.1 hypothetical protein A8B76_08705 [Roseovarius indicus]
MLRLSPFPLRLSATALLALTALLPAPSSAEVLSSSNPTIVTNLCVGFDCANNESFGNRIDLSRLRLKNFETSIEFVDSSTASGFATTDWTLRANEGGNGGLNGFSIVDATNGSAPFTIEASALSNSLYVASEGDIGLGTSLPQAPLHLETSADAGIRINRSGMSQAYEMLIDGLSDFVILDVDAGTGPFVIRDGGVPNYSFDLTPTGMILNRLQNSTFNLRYSSADNVNAFFVEGDNGNVGLGTDSPDAPLEISDDETFSYFRITATGAPVNQSVDITFTQGPLGTGEFRYNIVDGDGPEMRLNANGDMVLDGTLTTAGSCSTGCDAVFDADYPLPSIEDHQARTLALGHLPNVGPTRDGEPWDVTDKMGRILNELEHAHLYIGQLHRDLTAQQAEKTELKRQVDMQAAQIAALVTRLDSLETAD